MLTRTLAAVGLATTIAAAIPAAQQRVISFDVCARSVTWQRPSVDVQETIWSDARYRDLGAAAYAWTHAFLWSEPDSASLSYHQQNLSGLWTEAEHGQCPRRDGEQNAWAEVWALNHIVTGITTDGVVTTVQVVPQTRGYEIVQFRRQPSSAGQQVRLRFVDASGRTVAEWIEVGPGQYTDAQ